MVKIILGTIILLLLFLINFYRNPNGKINKYDNRIILAPSYGTVKEIKYEKNLVRIIIFLSPIDVHIQYCPTNGIVKKKIYDRTGQFNLAYKLNKSRYNEKCIHILENENGPITIYQVAGFLTRRIDSWVCENQKVVSGEPLGIIHFGSRVDIELPFKNGKPPNIFINPEDKLTGGKQVIAFYP